MRTRVGVSVALLALAPEGCGKAPYVEAPCATVEAELQTLDAAIRLYDAQSAVPLPRAGWFEALRSTRMISDEVPSKDAWGNAFVYLPGPAGFELSSTGPDGTRGTADDQTTRNGYHVAECRSGGFFRGCGFGR